MRGPSEGAAWLLAAAACCALVARALHPVAYPPPSASPAALPRFLSPDEQAAVLAAAETLTRLARQQATVPAGSDLEGLSTTPLLDNPAVEGVSSVADWCGTGPAPEADWLYCTDTRTVVAGGLDYQPSPAENE